MGTPVYQSAFNLLRKLYFLFSGDAIVEAVVLTDSDGNEISGYGKAAVVGATFNRPADTNSYLAGDLVANSTSAAAPMSLAVSRVNDGMAILSRFRLKTNDAAFSGKQMAVHVYKSAVTLAVNDNGVFNAGAGATESNKIGVVLITLSSIATSDGWYKGFASLQNANGDPIWTVDPDTGTKNVYAVLETIAAVTTPGSAKTWTLIVEVPAQN